MSSRMFTVLGRQWCHLCHDMVAALEPIAVRHGWRMEVLDVDEDPALEARWGELVPVLLADGVEICHYRLDPIAVDACCEAFR
ncbi:MAG: glutaredoxin family protein [Azoarcus sp.]|nr:glutaredoxin family protein [Azoarcus sp.]